MKPLWSTWRCRTNASLFLLTFAGFIVLGLLVIRTALGPYLVPILASAGLYLLLPVVNGIYRARLGRRQLLPRASLSRDEIRKARSKLMKPKTSL